MPRGRKKITPTFADQDHSTPETPLPPPVTGTPMTINLPPLLGTIQPVALGMAQPAPQIQGIQQPGLEAQQTVSFPNIPAQSGVQRDAHGKPNPLKIALVGTAPSSRMLAPYNDPTWQIWACSPGNMGTVPKADAWFELHGNLDWKEYKDLYGDKYIAWLKTLAIPIFMQDQRLVPQAKTFPKDILVEKFGPHFFTSSFAWMMAFAIHLGAHEIALYGIDMASPGEYILQRQGFYYFKEKAEAAGIKVSAPNESDIMQPPGLYGYSDMSPFGRKILSRDQEVKERIQQGKQVVAQKTAELEQAKDFVKHLEGALEDIDYFKTIWISR